MQQSDMIEIFKKHIQDINDYSSFKTNKENMGAQKERFLSSFSSDIKGANEFIGALQKVDIALKKEEKMCEAAHALGRYERDYIQTRLVEINASATFLGVALLDNELCMRFNNSEFNINIARPSFIDEPSLMLKRLREKRACIKEALIAISDAISSREIFEDEKAPVNSEIKTQKIKKFCYNV